MFKFRKVQIFRTFSANDWNQPESKQFVSLTVDPQYKIASILSSNAEKLRKFDSQGVEEN